jgi:MinD superfamily P-loop ATPase
MAILVTSPLGLAYSDPEELVETMSMISKNIYVLLYNPSSIDSTYTRNFLEETIPMLTSMGWRVIAIQGITS